METRNALRLKRNRQEITDAQLNGALKNLASDLEAGRLKRPDYDVAEVFHKAEELSAEHAVATGARSLDMLHVAAALIIRARVFVSFDSGQRQLAERTGLKVLP